MGPVMEANRRTLAQGRRHALSGGLEWGLQNGEYSACGPLGHNTETLMSTETRQPDVWTGLGCMAILAATAQRPLGTV